MFKRFFSFVVLASLLLAGCKDDNDTTVPEPTQPEPEVPVAEPGLTRFVFEVSKNAKHLISDLECTISGNEITGFVTYMTDISELVPTFEGEFYDIKVGPKAQQSGVTANDFTREVVYRVTNSKGKWKDYKVKVYSFTGLPVVTIETDGRAEITSKEDYVNGTMTISKTADYDEGFEGSIRIRGRGNATFLSYPKKPYKVKLDSKAEILGMPADKDWVLLANYTDKTLLRVAIAFKVSEMLEMPWTPKMHFVELFLNGRYQGSYQLGEHVKVAGHRLDVDDDGYMIERDNYYNLEPVYFTTEVTGQHFTFKYPDTDDLTSEQLTFINEYMNGFERALYSEDFRDPVKGYRRYIDPETFAKWYLINEVLCNKDTNPYFFLKNTQSGTRMGMSPVWDFEWSLGIGWNYTAPARHDELVQRAMYFDRLIQDPYFADLLRKHWGTLKGKLPELYDYINETAQKISLSQRENFKKWNVINTPVAVEVITLGTWENEVQYAKDFLTRRTEWFDEAIKTW